MMYLDYADSHDNPRNARRLPQADHLRQCGSRCILEALIAAESGEPLDAILADFERLPPELYHATLYLHLDGGAA